MGIIENLNEMVREAQQKPIKLCNVCSIKIKKQHAKTPKPEDIARLVFPLLCKPCKDKIQQRQAELLHNGN